MKMIAASLSRPGATTRLSTSRTTKDRADDASPAVRDAMFAAIPSLRAFAISLSGNVDRADDLVQETLLRAIANINSFHPGSHMSAWLITILRNLFRSEYRKATPRSRRRRRQLRRQPEIASPAAERVESRNSARRLQSCRPTSARPCFSSARRVSPTRRRLRSARAR